MKTINLDKQTKRIKEFVRTLPVDPDGSVLRLGGEPVLKVFPPRSRRVNKAKLRAAILSRRDESRRLNEDWIAVDREVWDQGPARLE